MKSEIAFFIIAGLIILSLIGVLFYSKPNLNASEQNKTVHIQKMPISFEITESYIIGINSDRNLKFSVGRGNSATKAINITNPFNIPVRVFINFSNEINKFISIPENNFVLGIDETKRVPITIIAPKDDEFKNYTGMMKLTMERIS